MKRKKVSIITTFYNCPEFIRIAINSVNAQLFRGFDAEYLLVDDCSTDNTREVVETFLDKYLGPNNKNPNIEFKITTLEKNLGCGGARKWGVDHATGDYLMFLDADDYWMHSDFLQRAFDTIEKHQADVVEFGLIYNNPSTGEKKESCVDKEVVLEDNVQLFEINLFRNNAIKFHVWTKIWSKKLTDTFPYSDSRTFEDVRTTPVWISNAKKIVIMPNIEINYRVVNNSIIHNDVMKTRLQTIDAIASLFERFKDNEEILKAMYFRAMVDLTAVLEGHSSENEGFIEMSKLNTKMLSYIYPDSYKQKTFDIEEWQAKRDIPTTTQAKN